MPGTADRVRRFRQLHEAGCFVIPNPWDVGSARVLAGLGFQALASTSSGFAWSEGRRDVQSSLEQTLAHFRALAEGVPVPINGDFRGGSSSLGCGSSSSGCRFRPWRYSWRRAARGSVVVARRAGT
jgi:2-methylisocitrate lyase-like PEP mutase family enzyme